MQVCGLSVHSSLMRCIVTLWRRRQFDPGDLIALGARMTMRGYELFGGDGDD